jgi:hypothetical protein
LLRPGRRARIGRHRRHRGGDQRRGPPPPAILRSQ